MSLHGKKGLGKKDKKKVMCDKILVHLKKFAINTSYTKKIKIGDVKVNVIMERRSHTKKDARQRDNANENKR